MADEVEMTPISPSEGGSVPPKVAPFGAAPASEVPAASEPAAAATAPTIKLKPVIRKPMIHKPTIGGAKTLATPAASAPTAAKKATQNLKSVTGPIPAQATLKKTGIIAEGVITQQQQQAAKSKTSRISLESAIGVSPTKEGPAPLKTIRLRRPTDLKPAGVAPTVPPPAEAAPAPVADLGAASAAEVPADDAGVTQKKTLKLQRPGGVGIKRPTLGVAKPAEGGDVQDISDMGSPSFAPLSPLDLGGSPEAKSGVPTWLAAVSLAVSIAALLVAGFLVYNFVGQNPTGTDANEMAVVSF